MKCAIPHGRTRAPARGDYWVYKFPARDFEAVRGQLLLRGYHLLEAGSTPDFASQARDLTLVVVATHKPRLSVTMQDIRRRSIQPAGHYLLASDHELPCSYSPFLNALVTP